MEDLNYITSIDDSDKILAFSQDKIKSFNTQIQNIIDFSENEFIPIGKKLQEFHSNAKEITGLSTSLANSMSSAIIGQSIDELRIMLQQINLYLDAVNNKFEAGQNRLELICQILNDISEKTAYFQYIVKHLRILGISTKIESARLGTDEQGFYTLADNVDNLSIKITEKSSNIREKIVLLLNSAREARSTILNLSGIEHENSNKILINSQKSLDSLVSQYKLSSTEVSRLSSHSEIISKEMGQVVVSVQYHDITKQQLEHVRDAFAGIFVSNGRVKQVINSSDTAETLSLIHNTCKLQRAQLDHSKDDLCSATQKMLDSLSNIGKSVSDIFSELSGVFEGDDLGQHSVLFEIEKNLTSVSETLANISDVEAKLRLSIQSVAKTINELAAFVEEIDSIGTEIELIALNASIKAARTGEDGAPMGVIAESIQKLSKEAKEQTAIIVESLSKVTVSSNKLYDDLTDNENTNNEKAMNQMTGNISSLLQLIGTYDIDIKSSLDTIKNKVRFYFTDIEKTVKDVQIHSKFREFVLNITDELNDIINKTSQFAKNQSGSASFNDIHQKYTMKSERDVFKKVISNSDSKTILPNKINHNQNVSEKNFGDNVELF